MVWQWGIFVGFGAKTWFIQLDSFEEVMDFLSPPDDDRLVLPFAEERKRRYNHPAYRDERQKRMSRISPPLRKMHRRKPAHTLEHRALWREVEQEMARDSSRIPRKAKKPHKPLRQKPFKPQYSGTGRAPYRAKPTGEEIQHQVKVVSESLREQRRREQARSEESQPSSEAEEDAKPSAVASDEEVALSMQEDEYTVADEALREADAGVDADTHELEEEPDQPVPGRCNLTRAKRTMTSNTSVALQATRTQSIPTLRED